MIGNHTEGGYVKVEGAQRDADASQEHTGPPEPGGGEGGVWSCPFFDFPFELSELGDNTFLLF